MIIVEIIRIIEAENWKTTSELRRPTPFLPAINFPFNTEIGLNPDRKKAG